NGVKKGTIDAKGAVNNLVSNHLMTLLEADGIKTHLVETLNDRDTVVKKVTIIPLEVIVRNIAAGSLAKRLGLAEGTKMAKTVLEYCYKKDELGDPMVNQYHIAAMGIASQDELEQIAEMAFHINTFLKIPENRKTNGNGNKVRVKLGKGMFCVSILRRGLKYLVSLNSDFL
ncbi:phosphoribosylaminoimidazolesuccinocarboxamide synthase, partial [Mariniphaga sediminis]|uniref:phosphoribosylaminoimidazolesuccinocarboxamide synthase n=1 Tax=Mariniphaga sediminis TaxID=1628158 RepID=UPI00356703C3